MHLRIEDIDTPRVIDSAKKELEMTLIFWDFILITGQCREGPLGLIRKANV